MAARMAGVRRVLFTAHGWAFNESRPWWQKSIFALFHLVTVWLSDTVICVSEAVRKDVSWIPFSKAKMVVIHHGIPQGVLVEKSLARAKLAPHLKSAIWIGTLAELHPTKGLHIAIEAFARIAPEFPDTSLVIIGEGQHRNHLVELVKKHGLRDRIHFCGHVTHASTLLPALDIFLFPSRSEALGYAALEAGNASLPVIASRVGGIPEIIEDGISGILVPVDDGDGFTNALISLLKNPELRTQLGQNLQNRVLTSFSKDRMLEQTLALYSNS
jgi:glycosyltransferase involved in cell wall biosynthesis